MELKDSLLASHSQQEKNSGWLGSRKRFPVRQSYPGSKMIQTLLVTICLAAFPYQGSSIILESGNVNDYEVVYPQKFYPLPKGGVQNAEPETKYEDTMKYEFKVNGEPLILHLERNKGLFAKDYSETHYSPDGRQITTIPPVQDHCYYHGYIQNDADSIAAISACNGLRGHFRHKGETYLIEPLKLFDSEAHAVYKSENVEMEDETPKICGVTHTAWESDEPIEKTSQSARTPEQNRYLRAPKFIEIFLVVDNKMYIKYTSSLSAIRTRVYELINTVNTMFRIMNIHIALIGLEVWNNEDKIKVQSDVDVTLNLFGAWRNAYLLLHKSHDNAQLLTGIDFNGTTVGYGYVGTMCHPNNSIAIVQDHTERISFMASTMAHELGHNLGIHHDTASCTCGSKPCIMTAELKSHPFYKFSSCSVQEHQEYLLRDLPQCILNKPLITDIVAPAVCGNYFVEVGEECDCGSPQDCKSTCCNATTCKLQSEAQCDSEECCEQCKFKAAGTECREAKNDCDKAERCTGRSAECPRDRSHKNGHPCQNNQGYCYKGKCPIMTNQCIALLGADKKVAPDVCFDNNVKGDEYFYCRRENGVNIPCETKDVKCGSLFCTPKISGNTITCEYIQLSDTDVAIVEPGTKCGDGMVCSNRQCVNVRTAY